jgi:hypothetical protein
MLILNFFPGRLAFTVVSTSFIPHKNGPFDAPLKNGLEKIVSLLFLYTADLKVIGEDTEKMIKSRCFLRFHIEIKKDYICFYFFSFTFIDINLRSVTVQCAFFAMLWGRQSSLLC